MSIYRRLDVFYRYGTIELLQMPRGATTPDGIILKVLYARPLVVYNLLL